MRRRAAWAAMTAGLVLAATVSPAGAAEPVVCNGQVATIVGTDSDDVIEGTDGDDVIAGLDGTDAIHGHGGADVICGQDGDSTFLDGGPGRDTLVIVTQGRVDGGVGDDKIDASGAPPGTVRLTFSTATQGVRVNLRTAVARGLGRDTVLGIADVDGTPYDDRIVGDDRDNMLSSGAGDDSLSGGDGNDFLSASSGIDDLTGGPGKDSLTGGSGDDLYRGSGGGDAMYEFNFTGNDTMNGGPGSDIMLPGFGDDTAFGGSGDDTVDGGADATDLGDYCELDIERRTNCERP